MSLTRVIARPLLSSVFIHGGLEALRHPESKVKAAEQVAGRSLTVYRVCRTTPKLWCG